MIFIIILVIMAILLAYNSSKKNPASKNEETDRYNNEISDSSSYETKQTNSSDYQSTPVHISEKNANKNEEIARNHNKVSEFKSSQTNSGSSRNIQHNSAVHNLENQNKTADYRSTVHHSNTKDSRININGHTVEYIDSTHTYLVDGHKIPCVSDILSHYARIHYLDDYYKVSRYTLQNAAVNGTNMHNAIEAYEKGESYTYYPEIENYKAIKARLGFEVMKMEQIVLYCNQRNEPLYAGRLDMIISYHDGIGILDLKRTYKVYREKFQLQLNLYRLAYEQSYHQKVSELFCLRLREEKANFYEFMIDEETAKDSVYSYLKLVRNSDSI